VVTARLQHNSRPDSERRIVPQNVKFGVLALLICIAQFLSAPSLVKAADWEYSVRPGDTLIGLANRYLIDPEKWVDLQQLNAVKNPRKLQPNSILRIPVEWLRELPATATVAVLHGEASVKRANEEKPLAVSDSLLPGDIVRTAKESSLVIQFVDGSKALLLKDSEIKLDRLGIYPKTGMAATELHLQRGRIESNVRPLKGAASRYEIRTPMAQLGVRGTDFRVGVDETSNSSLSEVLEGGVKATASAATIDVPKGFGTRVVQGEPPSPPVALLPPPDLSPIPALIERTPIRFRWAPTPTASGYRVQIERDQQTDAILNDSLFRTTEASFPDLPDGRYAMRVRAIDADGLEGFNATREIIVKARPEPPFLQSPEDKITVRGDRPQFKWAKVSDAAQYHFQLARDDKLSDKLVDDSGLQSNELAVAKPLAPGEYYWRVASLRSSGDHGPFGDVQHFTLKAIPVVAGRAAPPQVSDKTLTLQWKGGAPGQTYQLQLARNRDFSPLLKEETLAEPKIELQRPAGGVIFMRVKAIDSDGYEGPYGTPQEITVAPNQPVIKLKADDSTAKFNWPPGLDGQKIQLQVARNTTFDTPLLDTITDATEAEIQRPAGSEFFVRSRRIDSDGFTEEFSKPERVTLNEPFVQLESPKLEKDQIRFNWSAPLPGQKFRFQLARDAAFTSIVQDSTLAENRLDLKNPGAGRYYVRVATIDRDGFVAPYGPTQQFEVPRNYWPLLLLLPLLLL
jgi:hypothetical protein